MEDQQRQQLKPGRVGSTRFRRLEDGRWACFFMFDGKRARLLPSEDAGRRVRRESIALSLLGIPLLFAAYSLTFLESNSDAFYGFGNTLAGFAIIFAPYLLGALWLRRRYRQLPVTEEPLSAEETAPESRAVVWCVFMATVAMSFGAGYFLARNDPMTLRALGLGLVTVGCSAVVLNRLLVDAHR